MTMASLLASYTSHYSIGVRTFKDLYMLYPRMVNIVCTSAVNVLYDMFQLL